MEAIHSPFSFPSFPPSLVKQPTHQTRQHVSFIKDHRRSLTSWSRLQIQALSDAAIIAVNTSGTVGGNISVLLPISALLLSMYWVTNFVVPGIVMKDLQQKTSEGEEEKTEQQANAFGSGDDGASNASSSDSQPKKIKKADLKKMITQKRRRREQ